MDAEWRSVDLSTGDPAEGTLTGEPVVARTVLSHSHSNVYVVPEDDPQVDDFTFGTVRRASLQDLFSFMASCWEYDQVLGSVIAEEDYLRDGRVPSRTVTALCANLGHGLNVWKTAGYRDDPSDLMMPVRER